MQRPIANVATTAGRTRAQEQINNQVGPLLQATEQAAEQRITLQRLSTALEAYRNTGPFQGNILRFRQAVRSITGHDIPGTSEGEVFQAIQNFMVPRMRPAGQGSVSNFEEGMFMSAVPNFGNTLEGNRALLSYLQGMAEYRARVGELARQNMRRNADVHGNPILTLDFYDDLDRFSQEFAPQVANAQWRQFLDARDRAERLQQELRRREAERARGGGAAPPPPR